MTLGEYIMSYRRMHGMSQRKFAALFLFYNDNSCTYKYIYQ